MTNRLEDYFFNKEHKLGIHKWHHYFEVYDRHFGKFVGKNPNILEIGVYKGGSLEMWNDYFGSGCHIDGVDILERSREAGKLFDNVTVTLGDQADRNFWGEFRKTAPKFDIIIDDGGHTMEQQIVTFQEMYNHMSPNAVYLCEDLHTSYWSDYGGGHKKSDTFIEYSKNFIDMINAAHWTDNAGYELFRSCTNSIHYYDSVIVLEKRADIPKPVDSER